MRVGYLARRPESGAFVFLCFSQQAFSGAHPRGCELVTPWARMDSSISLSTPDTFPIFPYDNPYDIQLNLMQYLYSAIEDKAVAVVESPTGTVNR